jgi:hypothetical protein
MPTISSKVSELEHKVILEFASHCGLNVSEFIRRALMNEILFINGDDGAPQYELELNLPDEDDEERQFENFTNRFRKLFGIRPL